MESTPQITMPAAVRSLLGKLRDLNLSGHRVALDGGRWVSVEGCSSLDASPESGVRYQLAAADGTQTTLVLSWREGKLDLELREDPQGPLRLGALGPNRSLLVDVSIDGELACSRALAVRVRPASAGARELERVLRRVVRTLFG